MTLTKTEFIYGYGVIGDDDGCKPMKHIVDDSKASHINCYNGSGAADTAPAPAPKKPKKERVLENKIDKLEKESSSAGRRHEKKDEHVCTTG